MATFRFREASSLLRVGAGPLRRWAGAGRTGSITDASGRLAVEAADELGLEPKMLAVAAVTFANVSVEIPDSRPARPSAPAGEARRAG